MRVSLLGTIAILAPFAVTQAATAQQPSAQQAGAALADIMITAQRRPQSMQDVPVAVSAFSARALEQPGSMNRRALFSQVPNMVATSAPGIGSANSYFIRGLGSSDTIATADPAVTTYVDDIPLSRLNGNMIALFDLERVEVLRGPQGTLYGRNSSGGAVNLTLRQPGDSISGLVEGGWGSWKRKLLRGSIDLPMDPKVALKLSGFWADDDGYAKNAITGQRGNNSDMAGLRLAARVTPAPRLSWHVAVAYTEAKGENLLNFACDPAEPSRCDGRFLTTGMLASRRLGGAPQYSVDIAGRKANQPLGNLAATTLVTSNLSWAGDAHTLAIITGFVAMRESFALDFADGRALPDIANPVPPVRGFADGGRAMMNDGSHKQFTQEVRLTGQFGGGLVEYVAGFFLLDESNRSDLADLITTDDGTPAGQPQLLADRTIRNGSRATAGYAQADVHLSDRFTATAGIRHTWETRTFSVADNRGICAPDSADIGCLNIALVDANGVAIPRRLSTRSWTPRFALSWRASDDALLFASATRGFRAGGWNARGIRRDTLLPYDPESVWSYEAGMRTAWLNNRLRVNLTGFVLDVTNAQTPAPLVDPQSGAVAIVTHNGADYRNRGFELELAAAPVNGLNLYLNLGYQNDRYALSDALTSNRFGVPAVRQQQQACLAQLATGRIPLAPDGPRNAPDCAAGIVTADGRIATPVRTPDWTLAFGGSYEWPVPPAGIVLVPAVNILYRTAMETGTANASIWSGSAPPAFDGVSFPANPFAGEFISGSRSAAHWQVGASLAMRTDDDHWQLILECENCLDTSFTEASLFNHSYLNPPRSWMVRARRQF